MNFISIIKTFVAKTVVKNVIIGALFGVFIGGLLAYGFRLDTLFVENLQQYVTFKLVVYYYYVVCTACGVIAKLLPL